MKNLRILLRIVWSRSKSKFYPTYSNSCTELKQWNLLYNSRYSLFLIFFLRKNMMSKRKKGIYILIFFLHSFSIHHCVRNIHLLLLYTYIQQDVVLLYKRNVKRT